MSASKPARASRRVTTPAAARLRALGWTPARLMARAERARTLAYAPYSRFRVGAALLTDDGRVIVAANVENASFGLSMCAERNAVFKAVSEGARGVVAVAVTAGPTRAASPCGACRQVLFEFGPDIAVYWRHKGGAVVESRVRDLLPHGFGRRDLRNRK